MKRIRKFARFLGLTALAIAIACSPLCMTKVSAGSSDIVVGNDSFQESLDENQWNAPNADIVVEDGKLIFNADTTDGTRLIAKRAALASDYNEELFRAEYSIKLKEISGENKFLCLFGLDSIESSYGEPGNVELILDNANGLQASLVAYDDSGVETVLASPMQIRSSQMNIVATATTGGKLTIQINGATIFDDVVDGDLTGRLGFALTGTVEAEISELDMISHRYESPENADIVEDFEKGTINVNTLTSVMTSACGTWPASLVVEEYNGNQVLMFRNVSSGNIGTTHQYSNFEISFDIPYVLYRNIMREEGSPLQNAHQGFVVSFGDEVDVHTGLAFDVAPEAIVIGPSSISRFRDSSQSVDLSDKGYFSKENNTGYSVKIRVVDTQVTVYVKSLKASSYDRVMSYSLGDTTPLGYVHVWSKGVCNAAIDNLVIKNLDADPNLLTLDYKEGFMPEGEDWVYEPMEVVYREKQAEKAGFTMETLAMIEIAAGVLLVIVGVILFVILKKKAKKGACKK